MISQSTVEDVKASARIAEVIGEFITIKKIGANYECCCMFHEEKTPSFKIHVKENYYKCFGGCGKSGDPVQFLMEYKQWTYQEAIIHLANKYKIIVTHDTDTNTQKKVYVKPVWKNNTELPDKVVKWFEQERKISQATLQKMRVTAEKTWMPEGKYKDGNGNLKIKPAGDRDAICFNYFRDGELINIKYRDSIKTMRLFKDAELIPYNLDSLKNATEVAWVEGEADLLSLIEAGVEREGLAILSVPNGANIKSNNLTYLDAATRITDVDDKGEYIVKKIYLATDNDVAGRKLREDLANRLGKERCYYIEWKDQKDCNDVLKVYGKQGVLECFNAPKMFPIEGAYTVSAFSDELDDLYLNGLDKGIEIGIEEFDKKASFALGYLTIITGVPSHGKSSFLDQMALLLNLKHGWKFAMYSPENRPTKLHISKMARMLVGKNWFGPERMSEMEKNQVKNHLEGKFWFIRPPKGFSLQSILEKVKELKMRYGISAFTIDSWNKLEHKYKANETQYISEQLDLLTNFCEDNKLHCFLVAHPTKMEKDKKDPLNYVKPNLYSIAGSAAFFSKADIGMCVWRDYRTGRTHTIIQKVRESHWGEMGVIEWTYDKSSGRFNVVHAGDIVHPDYTNWITNERRQTNLTIPEASATPEIILNYEDPPF